MKNSIKNTIMSKAAIGSLILSTCAFSAHNVEASDFTTLGSGSEVRQYLTETTTYDLIAELQQDKTPKKKTKAKSKTTESKGKEGKCGEGKCGEGKCGSKKTAKEESGKTESNKESKAKEGKCGAE